MPSYNTITFENQKIIVIIDNNNVIWFNAKQICLSLDYKHTKHAIATNVDIKDKIQLKNMNITFELKQQPDSVYINEPGLYTLLISSKNKRAKKFVKWLTTDVLPILRKDNIKTTDAEINQLLKKINELEIKNKLLENDMKLEKFPDGAMVYVVEEYDIDSEIYYRIGKTDDMNKRIKIYNTHSIYNKKVVHYVELVCPLQLETCIRSMLYNYRYKNKKDYYKCSLNKIIKAFDKCLESIKCVKEHTGGEDNNFNNRKVYKIMYCENKLNKIKEIINLSTIS
jgi:prophage antirepressor-like protein